MSANGFHEVVIETPAHGKRFGGFTVDALEQVLTVYLARMRVLQREAFVESIALFRNEGREAGASQAHSHAQILALPVVPDQLRAEIEMATRYHDESGRCLSCETVESEATDGSRLVVQNGRFVAVTSFACRFPYETWILPTTHSHDFVEIEHSAVRNLAEILKQVLIALEATLGPFPFNLVIQTAPIRTNPRERCGFHWRIEILPRLTTPSGFELGSDVFIVSTSPEDAAARLRQNLGAPT